MNQRDYDRLSDQELKRYFLDHREDKAALQAYLDRRNQHPRTLITTVGDPDFDDKLEAAILQQLQEHNR